MGRQETSRGQEMATGGKLADVASPEGEAFLVIDEQRSGSGGTEQEDQHASREGNTRSQPDLIKSAKLQRSFGGWHYPQRLSG